ncbi:type III pantothenate kinase [Mycoplasmoides pirum]|uniref:type III pantothenate kinase n=1 Tax=Mycoplasmoides pirum TaxID=2122 RepID=UPI0004830568|nr:type III pantothenate kinase [Mycoplasmoides pirum]
MNSLLSNVLVIDVGNSYTKIAILNDKKKILKKITLLTKNIKSTNYVKKIIKTYFNNKHLRYGILGSVVLDKNLFFINAFEKNELKLYLINKKTKFNFEFDKKIKEKEVGNDILALATYCSYKAKNVLGFSFGTATVAILLINNVFKGASIISGLKINVESLFSRTYLINKIQFDFRKKNLLGNDTRTAIESGLSNLKNGFVSYLYDSVKSLYKFKCKNLMCIVCGHDINKLNVNFKYIKNNDAILIGYFLILKINL